MPPSIADASLAAILAIAADAIITVDGEYRIVQFNRGAEELFGYAAADALGHPLEMLIPPRFRAVHRGHVSDFAASAHPARRMGERREIWARRRDGREFPAEASISKVDAPAGRLYTVVLRDVTERHRAAAAEHLLAAAGSALARSLEWEDTARAAAAAGVPALAAAAVVVLDTRSVEGGDGTAELRAAAAAGRERPRATVCAAASRHDDPDVGSVLDALAAEAGALHAPLWCGLRADAGPVVVRDDVAGWVARHAASATVRALAGALRPCALLVVPLGIRGRGLGELTYVLLPGGPRADRDAEGARGAFDAADVALAGLLAERVALSAVAAQLYDDARHVARARDEVLAVVAHDLRNPLGAVGALVRALHDGVSAGTMARDEQLDTLSSVADAAGMADRLIRDLLDVARIDAGALRIERRRIAAGDVVTRVAALFAAPASARHVALLVEVEPGVPPLDADAARLVQALANLVDNALRYTPPSGRVMLRVTHIRDEEGGPAVAFAVVDTGAGIAAEDLPHLFDATWHAHRRARGAGSGLGLRIARGIALAHGGELRAESANGARFTIAVPAVAGGGGRALSH